MESPSRPLSWEVKLTMPPSSPQKSPVQRRLEASAMLEWRNGELLAGADQPPMLQLPTQVREAASERRRLSQIDMQVRTNAEHVDRAKRVAREIQLQRDAAAAQLKDSIELKLQAAQQRREEAMERVRERAGQRRNYLHRRPRRPSAHLASCLQRIQDAEDRRRRQHERIVAKARGHLLTVERKRKRVQHVRRVQDWWRTVAMVNTEITRLFDGCVSELHAKVITAAQPAPGAAPESEPVAFERLASHLSSPQVNDSAAALLSLLRVFKPARSIPTTKTTKLGTKPKPRRRSKAAVASLRQFLSSVMLLSHPNVVLGLDSGASAEDREAAESLLIAAQSMLSSLQKVVDATEEQNAKRTSIRLKTFAIARKLYDREFAIWRARDAAKLAREMQQTLVTIRVNLGTIDAHAAIAHNLAHIDPGAEQMRGGWARQDASIVRRVKQLLSPALMEEWMNDTQQRVAQEMVSVNREIEQHGEVEEEVQDVSQSDEAEEVEEEEEIPAVKVVSNVAIPTSPALPSNSDMVHELILNPQYRLTRIRKDTTDAALTHLGQELRRKELGMLTRVLQDVATRLCALTPNRTDLQAQIREALDVSHLAQQMRHGVFTAESFLRVLDFVGERVTELQAPARTAATRSWLQKSRQDISELASTCVGTEWTDTVPLVLARLLGDLADIEMDVANVHLGMLSSSLPRSESVSYLRGKWSTLTAESDSNWPARTREWMRDSYTQVAQPTHVQQQAKMLPVYVAHAFVGTLISETPMRDLPEVVELHDRSRVERLAHELTRLARLGTLELGLRHALGVRCGLRLPALGSLADRQLLGITREELNEAVVRASLGSTEAEEVAALADVTSALCAAADHACRVAASPLRDDLSAELGALARQALKGGPLFGVVHRRLVGGLRSAAGNGNMQVSMETLRGAGVEVWADAVKAVTGEVTNLVRLYCDVYGEEVLIGCLE